MNMQENQPVVVATMATPAVHQGASNRQDGSCRLGRLLLMACFFASFVLISMVGSKGSVISILVVFFVTSGLCVVFTRRHRIAQGSHFEARLATARLGNLNLDVLRGQQQSTLVDRETRRSLLHYFVSRPPGEASANKTGSESAKDVEEGAGTGGSCVICFGDLAFGEELCRLPCLHLYHAKCIDEWLDGVNHNWCPLCKLDVLAPAADIRPATGSSSNTTSTTTPINNEASRDVVSSSSNTTTTTTTTTTSVNITPNQEARPGAARQFFIWLYS